MSSSVILHKLGKWTLLHLRPDERGRADDVSGMKESLRKYPRTKTYLIGGQGMPLSEFLTSRPEDFL